MWVFEKRVLSRIFRLKRDEMTRVWRKTHIGELHNLFSSPNTSIIRTIKSSRIRWEGHIARIGERRGMQTGFWWERKKEIDH
jgi:hypothetical protein